MQKDTCSNFLTALLITLYFNTHWIAHCKDNTLKYRLVLGHCAGPLASPHNPATQVLRLAEILSNHFVGNFVRPFTFLIFLLKLLISGYWTSLFSFLFCFPLRFLISKRSFCSMFLVCLAACFFLSSFILCGLKISVGWFSFLCRSVFLLSCFYCLF